MHALKRLSWIFPALLFVFSTQARVPVPGTNFLWLDYWDFADTTNWTTFLDFTPISYTNISSTPLRNGTALVVDSTNAAWINYNVNETNGWTNLTVDVGSVMFWFSPNWSGTNVGGAGPGTWGRLVEAGAYTTNASVGWWSLYLDPAGANIIFSAQTNNGAGTNYLVMPVSWTNGVWHLLSLTYSSSNTVFYLDGGFATNGPSMTVWPGRDVLTNGFWIGSDSNGVSQAHGNFSGLSTYSYQLDSNTIEAEYVLNEIFYGLGTAEVVGLGSAPSTPVFSPNFDAITGPGDLTAISLNTTNCITSSNLWITNVAAWKTNNGTMTMEFTIAGGSNGIPYDVFATTYLTGTNPGAAQWAWMGQGYQCVTYTLTNLPGNSPCYLILGTPQDSDGDGLTDAYELLVSKTNPNNPDTDGDGLTDGWEVLYGSNPINPASNNSGIPDGYQEDPAKDGWNNIQKLSMGIAPNTWVTPPAPTGLKAAVASGGTNVSLAWNPSFGSVVSYTILRQDDQSGLGFETLTTIAATGTPSYIDLAVPFSHGIQYEVMADFVGGSSSPSAPVDPMTDLTLTTDTHIVRGPQGNLYFVASATPPNVSAYRIYITDLQQSYYPISIYNVFDYGAQLFTPNLASSYFDIPVTNLVSGACQVPTNQVPPFGSYQFQVQAIGTNGKKGSIVSTGKFTGDTNRTDLAIPFLDGRTNIAQNINFLLRTSLTSGPFNLDEAFFSVPYTYYGTTNYVSAGLYFCNNYLGTTLELNEFQPFEENNFYFNFCYSPTNINPSTGSTETGIFVTGPYAQNYMIYAGEAVTSLFDTYGFITGSGNSSLAPVLSPSAMQWIFIAEGPYPFVYPANGDPPSYTVPTENNFYGLALQSLKWPGSATPPTFPTATPGTVTSVDVSGSWFMDFATPSLNTVNYYFARPHIDPMPGEPAFTPSQATPSPIIISVGQTIALTAWAKQAIQNGASNKFAFAGQYFDKAYLCDAGGNITTNQTGILSEYGEFFPTQAGKVILTTKPDAATGTTGQCTIYVIGLQLDVNHDGTMDMSYAGPDNTSTNRPFVFWANNNFDRYTVDSDGVHLYDDDVASYSKAAFSGSFTGNQSTPDYNFQGLGGQRTISCVRDLQDFTRLWISGVTGDLRTALPTNSAIVLSWGDVGNPNPTNPTIDLFTAYESGGGIGYLTNQITAQNQSYNGAAPYIQRLGPGQSLQLNAGTFLTNWAGNYFIWCGVTNGSGALTLTISDGNGNKLAQSVSYIQIKDIKQLYERWTIGDAPGLAPTTSAVLGTEDLPPFAHAFQYDYNPLTDATTPYILFVHGWNMETWEKDRFAESAFKRLYWQGYQGRFGSLRWPTRNGFTGTLWSALTDSINYDASEHIAWESATGLLNKLSDLNSNYPGQVYVLAHSMGNVVAGEALRLAGTNVVLNTYVASQAAIPAHVYDGTSTNLIDYSVKPSAYLFAMLGHPIMPNIYSNRLAGNAAAVSRRINYFNTNDYALSPFAWCFDQVLKPDNLIGGAFIYTGSTNDPPPWNNFVRSISDGPYLPLDIVSNINDRYTVLAYAAQPYSKALGATAGLLNITEEVDLPTLWLPDPADNNYGDRFWHSAEFRGDCWQEWNYWNTLLRSSISGFDINN